MAGTDFNPSWGQSTIVSTIEIDGNATLKYANFNYQGTQFAEPLDVEIMEFLHLDMWTADATSVNVFCISTGPVETAFALPITPGQWESYDIPLGTFTGVDFTDLIQFKFDGGNGAQTIYLDNLYFYKGNPTNTNELAQQNKLKLYPNPVAQGEVVRLDAQVQQFDVIDLNGRTVLSVNNTFLQTGELSKGIYLIRMIDKNEAVQMQKLVVK